MVVYEPTDEELALARGWYAGSGSMLYAIASTGALSTGTIRPSTHDGDWAWRPMTDAEWSHDLAYRLWEELHPIADQTGEPDAGITAYRWRVKLNAVLDALAEAVEAEAEGDA